MAAVSRAAALHRLMKWQMLERVQRVVVDENPDRSLRRQKMSRMLDEVPQVTLVFGAVVRWWLMCRWRGCLLHGGNRPFWRGRASCRFVGRNGTIHDSLLSRPSSRETAGFDQASTYQM